MNLPGGRRTRKIFGKQIASKNPNCTVYTKEHQEHEFKIAVVPTSPGNTNRPTGSNPNQSFFYRLILHPIHFQLIAVHRFLD